MIAQNNMVFSQVYDDLSRAVNRAKLLCKSNGKNSEIGGNLRARGRPKGSKDTKPRKKKSSSNETNRDVLSTKNAISALLSVGMSSIDVISLALSSPSLPCSPISNSDVADIESGPNSRMSICYLLD